MIGFKGQEIQAFRSVMLEMDADMVKVDSVTSCKLCFQQTLQHIHTVANLACRSLSVIDACFSRP